jgi:dsRNA-specific ribonuclease
MLTLAEMLLLCKFPRLGHGYIDKCANILIKRENLQKCADFPIVRQNFQ